MELTAVEWLIEEMHKNVGWTPIHIQEQANKMFEQQIIKAHNNGKLILPPNESGEQYYNETFKNK